jgi:ribonuclease Z
LELKIFSKALYSTWVIYKPERILFDVGEGISTMLGNSVYGIKVIFLTHGHVDHLSGLWGFINTRNAAMGDREKPMQIYYPVNNIAIEKFRDFILDMNPRLRYQIQFVPINAAERIFLRKAGSFERSIMPFKTFHTANERSFGYTIYEKRKKLKDEYKNLDKTELIKIINEKGRDEISDVYEKKILTISGDCHVLPLERINNSETLIHECTFLKGEDRRNNNHTTIDELIEVIDRSEGVKRLILYHISGRYINLARKREAEFVELFKRKGIELYIVHPDRLFCL